MAIHKWLEKVHTPPTMTLTIITILSQWTTTGNVHLVDEQPVFLAQQDLGWHHFIEGRLHHLFETTMDNHYSSIGSRKTGRMWTSVFIQKIWTELHHPQWLQRNKYVHALDETAKLTRTHMDLNSELRTLYEEEVAQPLLHKDQHLLSFPITHLLKRPTAQNKAWILEMRSAVDARNRTYQQEDRAQIVAMRNWLNTSTIPPSEMPLSSPPATSVTEPAQKRRRTLTQARLKWEIRKREREK